MTQHLNQRFIKAKHKIRAKWHKSVQKPNQFSNSVRLWLLWRCCTGANLQLFKTPKFHIDKPPSSRISMIRHLSRSRWNYELLSPGRPLGSAVCSACTAVCPHTVFDESAKFYYDCNRICSGQLQYCWHKLKTKKLTVASVQVTQHGWRVEGCREERNSGTVLGWIPPPPQPTEKKLSIPQLDSNPGILNEKPVFEAHGHTQ